MSNVRASQHGKITFLLTKINKLMQDTIICLSFESYKRKLYAELNKSSTIEDVERRYIESTIKKLENIADDIKSQESSITSNQDRHFTISDSAALYYKGNIDPLDSYTLNPYKTSLVNNKRFSSENFDAPLMAVDYSLTHVLNHYVELFNYLIPIRDLLIATSQKFLMIYQNTHLYSQRETGSANVLRKSFADIDAVFTDLHNNNRATQHLTLSRKKIIQEKKNAENPEKSALIKAQKQALPALGALINDFTFNIPNDAATHSLVVTDKKDDSDNDETNLNLAHLKENIAWAAALSEELFGTKAPNNSPKFFEQADKFILSTLTDVFINQRKKETQENNGDAKESGETSKQAVQIAANVIAAGLQPDSPISEPPSPLPSPRRPPSTPKNNAVGNIQSFARLEQEQQQNTGCCQCVATWWNKRKAEQKAAAQMKERLLPAAKKAAR